MYKQCKTEQSAMRQRELERGLLEAMSKRHYDDISVSDLCDEIGIPRKSFYRYFDGKDDALHALIDHALMDYDLHSSPDVRENCSSQQYMEMVFSYWYERKEVLDALAKSGLSGLLIQRAISWAMEETNTPIRFLARDLQKEKKQVTIFLVCGLMTMVVQWHHDGYAESVSRMGQLALRLLTQPLVTEIEP